MYMLTQIAVAVCTDLQLARMIAEETDAALKAEMERTYLGTYYLSSW